MAEEANPVGRPLQYKTPEEMQIVIDKYFDEDAWYDKDKTDYRPTISGLCYALDISRETLKNYKEKDEFLYTVNAARKRIEMELECRLYGTAVTGMIFNLKNNFGWKDKSEVDQTNNGELNINIHSV